MRRLWTPWRMEYIQQDKPESGCIFCAKISSDNDRKEHVLWRGEHAYITLNLYPYNNGHLLVVPYDHVPSLEDLSVEALAEVGNLVVFSLRLLRETMAPEGFNIGVNQGKIAGAGVADHVHVHVVPRWGGDTNFMTVVAGTRVIPEWIDRTYERLMETLEKHPELRP